MTEAEQKLLRELLADRLAVALNRLKDEPHYLAACRERDQQEAQVDELMQRFEKPERILIRRYYEDDINRTNIEMEAVYLQGLRDSTQILAFIGAFTAGISA